VTAWRFGLEIPRAQTVSARIDCYGNFRRDSCNRFPNLQSTDSGCWGRILSCFSEPKVSRRISRRALQAGKCKLRLYYTPKAFDFCEWVRTYKGWRILALLPFKARVPAFQVHCSNRFAFSAGQADFLGKPVTLAPNRKSAWLDLRWPQLFRPGLRTGRGTRSLSASFRFSSFCTLSIMLTVRTLGLPRSGWRET